MTNIIIYCIRASIPVHTEEGLFYSPVTRYFQTEAAALEFGKHCTSFSITEVVVECS